MSDLAQYFTQDQFSDLLTSNIIFDNPRIILDLGIGDGSLTCAAQKKWKNANFYGVDVDNDKVVQLHDKLENISLYNLNSLDADLHKKINIKVGSVDIAICNPPYLNIKRRDDFIDLLFSAGLSKSVSIKNYTTDLLFFAKNLALLKRGGILGIILPAGLLCGHEFQNFRSDLLSNHSIETIIELQSRIFKKTDAKTFIVIVKKSTKSANKILLSGADENGTIYGKILVSKNELLERMDFSYHQNRGGFVTKGPSIKDLATRIQRGNYTNLELRKLGVPYFHTTDFKNFPQITKMPNHTYEHLKRIPTTATKGDILLGRVGKGCHNQLMLIQEGQIAITDCIYKISFPKSIRSRAFTFLNSSQGRNNLKFIKHGVCAQVISKRNLEEMILDLNTRSSSVIMRMPQ